MVYSNLHLVKLLRNRKSKEGGGGGGFEECNSKRMVYSNLCETKF